ncbi:HD domain-containing phosphohydrolase [Aliagarivorans marinus]|uniref:HD domain-containing phosphohydrolase n=1 Tax=Aliagarivorans marinus TaxID=561965 RepID=UPI0003FACA40|nr:HD domain-containing phosphohydrolase [Aliagarivorans marinus]
MKRYWLYLAGTTLTLLVVMSFTTLVLTHNRQYRSDELSAQLDEHLASIQTQLDELSEDAQHQLRFLSSLDSSEHALAQGQLDTSADILSQLMASQAYILQARLLSSSGQELLRFDSSAAGPIRTSNYDLQNKARRYYVAALLSTAPDEVYFSSIDLNVERGVIELPYQPVLRVGMAVTAKDSGQILGFVLLNYDMRLIFAKLQKQLSAHMQAYLVAPNGQFLLHPSSNRRYCKDLNCSHYFDKSQLTNDIRQQLFFEGQMASITLAAPSKDFHPLYGAIVLRYSPEYLPAITAHDSSSLQVVSTPLWWVWLAVTLALCTGTCGLLEYRIHHLKESWQRMKMHGVLEKITELIERVQEDDDPVTGSHVQRVSYYSKLMAAAARLEPSLVQDIYRYASLHDIGKISIPDAILKKPGKLDPQEWAVMQTHVENGYQLIKEFNISPVAENIVRCHHERWDGTGYPRGLKGTDIPVEARIVSIVDCFDALMSERPYKPAFSFEKSAGIINELSGSAFEPELVRLFNLLEDEFAKFRTPVGDSRTEELLALRAVQMQ